MARRFLYACAALLAPVCTKSYGFDCSFPIHHQEQFDNSNDDDCPGLKHRKAIFDKYIQGCREHYEVDDDEDSYLCGIGELRRLAMNRDQPKSIVNFTETGYKHISGSEELRTMLQEFWTKNNHTGVEEQWGRGDIHTNHWESDVEMISVNDDNPQNKHLIVGATQEFRDAILGAVQPTIEEWTGMGQKHTSLYGVRVYREGIMLSPHCDRLPLVSSAIINVAQDVDEDWPLEVYGRDGRALNITMKPGDIVLYESASIIHGRPFPLKGRYYANIFIHFMPVSFLNGEPFVNKDDPELPPYVLADTPSAEHHKLVMRRKAEIEQTDEIEEDDEDEDEDEDDNEDGDDNYDEDEDEEDDEDEDEDEDDEEHVRRAHWAAADGDIEALQRFAEEEPDALHTEDKNGWKPLHEAIREGQHDVVELLLRNGAGHNDRTLFGIGQSPLNLALESHGNDHPITKLLLSVGAVDVASEWRDHDEF